MSEIYGGIRKLDKLGRIVIPKELRYMMGLNTDDKFNVYKDGDRVYMIKLEREKPL